MNEKELEKIFKAVANRRRIMILKYLKREHHASVGDIAEEIKLSFRATSKHLSVLSNVGFLDKDQSGPSMLYFIPENKKQLVSRLLAL